MALAFFLSFLALFTSALPLLHTVTWSLPWMLEVDDRVTFREGTWRRSLSGKRCADLLPVAV